MPSARVLAERIVATLTPEERAALAEEPFAALERLGFKLRMRPDREIPGVCSVAASLDHGPPPVITVVAAASTGRRRFSALHEYGHWAINGDTDIHDVFFDEHDGGEHLEEDVCDAIAAELLMPAAHVDTFIGPGGPTAHSVIELIRSTPNASLEACCVRAAERLNGPGHVMLARGGIAQFTASHSSPYRVRRGTPQSDDHITVKAGRRGHATGEDVVTYGSGARSDIFFADAASGDDGLVIAVFMENRPPWIKGLALPTSDRTADAEIDAYCTHCEVDFVGMGAPCPKCDGYFHRGQRGCGKCSCTPASQHKLCGECFIRRTPSEFTQNPEICDVCLGV